MLRAIGILLCCAAGAAAGYLATAAHRQTIILCAAPIVLDADQTHSVEALVERGVPLADAIAATLAHPRYP